MVLSVKDIQMTPAFSDGDDLESGNLEDVRLLDDVAEIDSGDTAGAEIGGGNSRRIQLSVGGMTCAACSNSVESALLSVNGVIKASVALLQNQAFVVFDPDLLKVCPKLKIPIFFNSNI